MERQGAFARAVKFYAPSARMRTAARRICFLAQDISPQRSCKTPLRTSRRRNLRALSKASKPNTSAKTKCSATSFAILRRRAKRGCGRTSASEFKARRIKFKICLRSALAPNSESLILRVRPAPYGASEIYKFLATKFKPPRRAKWGSE